MTDLFTHVFRLGWPLGATYLWSSSIGTKSSERFCSPLRIGMVVLSASLMSPIPGRRASTRASQKSLPGMKSVLKRSTTLNFTIDDWNRTLTKSVIVSAIENSRLPVSFTLVWDSRGLMGFCNSKGIKECLVKLEPAPGYNTTVNRVVEYHVGPG